MPFDPPEPLVLRRNVELFSSACPHDCPSTCALEVERLDGRTIGRVHGAKENSYTAGIVCAKVARYAERIHHPDRLTTPLRRIGAKGIGRAAFEPLSWEAALDEVAERLKRAAEKYGPETVWPYFYAGTMGLVQRDGIERLRHVMKYSRQHSTICVTLSDTGWIAGCGAKRGVDAREIAESDLVIVWGGNPVHTQVNVMHHIALARKERGAKFVVVDPYRTPTAELADIHVMPRPGTDGALAAAMMHVLFKEGYADWDYLERYTDAPRELEAHLRDRTPAWASRITGLPAEEIVAFARLYGSSKRSYIRAGYGFSRSRNGSQQMHAVASLPAVTGAWRHRGGGALYGQTGIYPLDKTLIMGLDALDPKVRVLDQSRMGPILTGDPRDLGEGPPVTALFIQNTNPVTVCPEGAKVREGFARGDLFVCVHEQFMTETAAMADIVLPATTFLEHDDFYIASGHTNLQVTKRVVEPVGESRSNHDVLCGLAARLGAEHPGFAMTAWEMIDKTLEASGLPDAETAYRMRWVDCARSWEEMHFLDGFGHADKKFHFKADWAACGQEHARMSPFPDHIAVIDEATEEHPFRLVAAPSRSFLNTSFTETPSSRAREGRPTALVHPGDLGSLGLAAGERVRLGNARGSVVVHAKPFDGLQRGVVVVEGIWPNGCFEEGRGINTLTSADPGLPKGGAVFHDTAVWLRRA
ncbi:MAG TPA: molybdopterin oxidoreductase family protein [Alphaproteobacteria bacterium]|nr:molybdopterin oxidoreductase family protein [Alphaproteobacteria bacterium]